MFVMVCLDFQELTFEITTVRCCLDYLLRSVTQLSALARVRFQELAFAINTDMLANMAAHYQ